MQYQYHYHKGSSAPNFAAEWCPQNANLFMIGTIVRFISCIIILVLTIIINNDNSNFLSTRPTLGGMSRSLKLLDLRLFTSKDATQKPVVRLDIINHHPIVAVLIFPSPST